MWQPSTRKPPRVQCRGTELVAQRSKPSEPSGRDLNIGIGTLTQAKVHAREVFKAAILASADSILLSHNHPGGLPLPSPGDLRATRALVWAGNRLGIEVKDHIIVVPNGNYLSMHASGFLRSAVTTEIDVAPISEIAAPLTPYFNE